jgi:MOSC domain-containing protein YiiM
MFDSGGPAMKVLSVNVGRPRGVEWRDEMVHTAIHKAPVHGRVAVARLNLDGDQQADLSVHGGPEKAVYVYPSEHYAFWRRELPDAPLGWGAFGENLTTDGLLESTVRIGDQLRIGTTELVVTQPRMPCYKLGVRFQRADMVKRFLRSGRTGFYLAVMKEGNLGTGDIIARTPADERAITVAEVVTLYTADADSRELLQRAVTTAALPQAWRDHFQTRLWEADC